MKQFLAGLISGAAIVGVYHMFTLQHSGPTEKTRISQKLTPKVESVTVPSVKETVIVEDIPRRVELKPEVKLRAANLDDILDNAESALSVEKMQSEQKLASVSKVQPRIAQQPRLAVPAVPPRPGTVNRAGFIFEGLVGIERHHKTGPIDGCSKMQKGLINTGEFLLFTCEKLLPYYPIDDHASTFTDYKQTLQMSGWNIRSSDSDEGQRKWAFTKMDGRGCRVDLDMTLWTDRSMNEPSRPGSQRDAHRQIMFMTKFRGSACEGHYKTAESLASRPRLGR